MNRQITFRDWQNLSAHLDGQLSPSARKLLTSRLSTEPQLAEALEELSQVRALLRRTPVAPTPRNFTLAREEHRVKPPVSPLVPALSWASAVAMLLFIGTFGTNLLGKFSFGAAAPMMSAAPAEVMGGEPAAEAMMATEAPVSDATSIEVTATPEVMLMTLPEATIVAEEARNMPLPPDLKEPGRGFPPDWFNPWLAFWLGLALILIITSLLVRWLSVFFFRRRPPPQ